MVGTRQESFAELNTIRVRTTIADECGADEIYVVIFLSISSNEKFY